MARQTISDDPSRKIFVPTEGPNDNWECKDYKTFYMTIRQTNLPDDKAKGRDPNHYCLFISSGDIFYGIKDLLNAFKMGYDTADKTYESRYPGITTSM